VKSGVVQAISLFFLNYLHIKNLCISLHRTIKKYIMKSFIKKAFLITIALKNKATKKLDKLMEQEPQIKDEYVNKVVYLLRRDFSIEEQNEIMLSITKKLNELRSVDIDKMAREIEHTQKHTLSFKSSLTAL
jgi:hypothetical protein